MYTILLALQLFTIDYTNNIHQDYSLYLLKAECRVELADDGPQYSCEVLCDSYPDEVECK